MKPFLHTKVFMHPQTGELSAIYCEGGKHGALSIYRLIHQTRYAAGWTQAATITTAPKELIYMGRL